MTGKDIARMAFEQVKPPRVPVTVIGGGAWNMHAAGKTFCEIKSSPETIADVQVRAFRRIGHDLIWTGAGFLNYPIHCLGCSIQDNSSDAPSLVGTAIKTLREVDSLNIDTVFQNSIMKGIIHSQHLVADEIGKETFILQNQWGPFTTASRIVGIEALIMGMMEDPEKVNELIRFSAELVWASAERILAHNDIPGMCLCEPVASEDMISPSLFREFVAPVLNDLVTRARAIDKYSMIHICGNSTDILSDVLAIGPDCFSLESKVDLGVARKILGGKVCVVGNMSPTGVFWSGSPEEVVKEGVECVKKWGDESGYILSLGCDFPKDVPFENIHALMSIRDVDFNHHCTKKALKEKDIMTEKHHIPLGVGF
ncbi:MAG: hypothetical protein HN416_11085, partial [Nitrospina sp.]|nr:hypothetical protein [Nitrospina sp.]